ncbi:hypothetical protein [Nostoc piscinale]|uniref:hypothetical protein n=1 Tax=Nostoc piscinale TaxID=224012 RepID=UPI003AAE862F
MEFLSARCGLHHESASTFKVVPFHDKLVTTKELVLPSFGFLAVTNVADKTLPLLELILAITATFAPPPLP